MGKCSHNPYKKKNRTAAAATPPSQRPAAATQTQAVRRPGDGPRPHNVDDTSRIRLIPDPPPSSSFSSAAFAGPGNSTTTSTEAPRESRANRLGAALRSKILFPLTMLETINDLAAAFALQLKASTPLVRWLTFEMARSSVQADKCHDLLQVNELRVFDRIQNCWDDDNNEKADKLGRELPVDPYNVKRALERTKHGALYLLEAWTLLAESVEASGGLDEPQRQLAFDLLGIAPVHRATSIRVPAGTDTNGLKALVARETGRLRTRLDVALNARSETEQEMAHLGIVKQRDVETRNLRADLTRARRRFSWALETVLMLQRGADPSGIIDPETGKSVAVGPAPSAVPEASAGRSATPTPAAAPAQGPAAAGPPPSSSSSSSSTFPPLPAGCSEEQREIYCVAAAAILGEPAVIPGFVPGPSSTA